MNQDDERKKLNEKKYERFLKRVCFMTIFQVQIVFSLWQISYNFDDPLYLVKMWICSILDLGMLACSHCWPLAYGLNRNGK